MKCTDKQIIAAFKRTGGRMTETANILGIDRCTLYQRIQRNPELLEIRDVSRCVLVGHVEDVLIDLIDDPNTPKMVMLKAAKIILETMGQYTAPAKHEAKSEPNVIFGDGYEKL